MLQVPADKPAAVFADWAREPFHERLTHLADSLIDAAMRWANRARETEHSCDAEAYANVAGAISKVASSVQVLRVQWTPQIEAATEDNKGRPDAC